MRRFWRYTSQLKTPVLFFEAREFELAVGYFGRNTAVKRELAVAVFISRTEPVSFSYLHSFILLISDG